MLTRCYQARRTPEQPFVLGTMDDRAPRWFIDRMLYRTFGPTFVHLKLEAFLLLCLTLLTASSLQVCYGQEAFQSAGDYIYVLLVFLWQSRYLLCRWLGLWDPSTSRTPSLRGFLSVFLQSHVMAGQTFDRPTHQNATKSLFTSNATQSRLISFTELLPTAVLYALQMTKVWIWFPMASVFSFVSFSAITAPLHPALTQLERRTIGLRAWLRSIQQYAYATWMAHGPTVHFLLQATTVAFLVVNLYRDYYKPTTPVTITSLNKRSSSVVQEDEETAKAYGAYKPIGRPDWSNVWYYLCLWSFPLSMTFFRRLVLPVADQVAGGNVIRDVRHETRVLSSDRSSKSKASGRGATVSSDAPFPERLISLASDNRFRLFYNVRTLRICENIILCGVFPRLNFVCRATGHCPAGADPWELTYILFPTGIRTPRRTDVSLMGTGSWALMERGAALWVWIGIGWLTFGLLTAQMVVLNRTYMATLSYISSEWELVLDKDLIASKPPVWDARRRYKKGDLVLCSVGRRPSVYRATINAPEAIPSYQQKIAEHLDLKRELGHPGTSSLLVEVAERQTILLAMHATILFVTYCCRYSTAGRFTSVAAHALASFALETVGVQNLQELRSLNAEIVGSKTSNI